MLPAIDTPLFHLINATPHSSHAYIATARWASTWLPGLLGAALALWMWLQGSDGRRSVYRTLVALAVTWLVCKLIRWGLPMPRPVVYGMGMQWIAHASDPSMPSLHAAGAFALAQAVQLAWSRTQHWVPALVWLATAMTALSRVVLGVHFPTDILAGLVVGCASTQLVWWLTRRHTGPRPGLTHQTPVRHTHV